MTERLNSFPEEWQAPLAHNPLAGDVARAAVFGADRELNVRFVLFPEIDEFKTQQNTERGILKKEINYKEYIRVQRIGDKSTVYFQPAKPSHKMRFPQQYEAFKAGKQQRVGIPLEAWEYQLSETEIYTLRLLGIEFVHQLADMNDVQMLSLGPDAKNLRARAKVTCAELCEKEAAAQLQAKFDEMEARFKALQAQLNGQSIAEQPAIRSVVPDMEGFDDNRVLDLIARKESEAAANDPVEQAVKRRGRPRKDAA